MTTNDEALRPISAEQLSVFLSNLIQGGLTTATMIWGPPGIGKSSVVSQVCAKYGLQLIDLRISQLAPTDLRGLPIPANGEARWLPPEFLPRGPVTPKNKDRRAMPTKNIGVLFLDEFNMASSVMQGIAQQLILDRRVGDYMVPDGWYIWAAGNRREDNAAVSQMSGPLANRFLHLEVAPDYRSFRAYMLDRNAKVLRANELATEKGQPLQPLPFAEEIISFLEDNSELHHKLPKSGEEPAWPSPRSWEVAAKLHNSGLGIGSAVGMQVQDLFDSFLRYRHFLQINGKSIVRMILEGKGATWNPENPEVYFKSESGEKLFKPTRNDVIFSISRSLAVLPRTEEEGVRGAVFIAERFGNEYLSVFLQLFMPLSRTSANLKNATGKMMTIPLLRNVILEIGRSMISRAPQK